MNENIDNIFESPFSTEEMEAHLTNSFNVVRRIESKEITREQGLEELMRQGSSRQAAEFFLLHTLDQERLNTLRQSEGIIID